MWICERVVRGPNDTFVLAEGGGIGERPTCYYLKPNTSFKIGRKQVQPPCIVTGGADINDDDKAMKDSVSRLHAELTSTLNAEEKDKEKKEVLTLMDLGSKFGTHVRSATAAAAPSSSAPSVANKNFAKLEANVSRVIADNDVVRFGHTALLRFRRTKLAFCCTRLHDGTPENVAEKSRIVAICSRLCIGRVTDSVEEATHLVTSQLSATTKVLVAVALQKPIVTPAWLLSFVDKDEPYTPLLSTETFLPPTLDKSDNFDKLGTSRRQLLAAFLVVLTDKNDLQYEALLRACGATVQKAPAADTALEGFFKDLSLPGQVSSLCLLESTRGANEAYTTRLSQCRDLAGRNVRLPPCLLLTLSAVCKAVMTLEPPKINGLTSPGVVKPVAQKGSGAPAAPEALAKPAGAAGERVAQAPRDQALSRQETIAAPAPLTPVSRKRAAPDAEVPVLPKGAPHVPAAGGGSAFKKPRGAAADAKAVEADPPVKGDEGKGGKGKGGQRVVVEEEQEEAEEDVAEEAEEDVAEEEDDEEGGEGEEKERKQEAERLKVDMNIELDADIVEEDGDEEDDGWLAPVRGDKRRKLLEAFKKNLPTDADGEPLKIPANETYLMRQSELNARALAAATASSSSSSSSNRGVARANSNTGPDFRKFRKNQVSVAAPDARISFRDMAVAPARDSERRNAVKEEVQQQKKTEAFKEELFMDRFERSK